MAYEGATFRIKRSIIRAFDEVGPIGTSRCGPLRAYERVDDLPKVRMTYGDWKFMAYGHISNRTNRLPEDPVELRRHPGSKLPTSGYQLRDVLTE